MNPHPQVLRNIARLSEARAFRSCRDFLTRDELREIHNRAIAQHPSQPQVHKREPFNPLKL